MVSVDILTIAILQVILFVVLGALVYWRTEGNDLALNSDQLNSALAQSLEDLEVNENIGRVKEKADDIADLHTNLQRMLTRPKDKGDFGEQQLEILLEDRLPPDKYGTQEAVVGSKRPDAYIDSPVGTICIDSKFPLKNYKKYIDASERSEEAEEAKEKFRDDVEDKLEAIEDKYIAPEEGTAEFAFAFLPSEAVYYHLIRHEHDLLQEYTKRGVLVVSPLTLGHQLELISSGVEAERLSEQAEEVQDQLQTLRSKVDGFEDDWSTLRNHIDNAQGKAGDVNSSFQALQSELDRIADFEVDQ